VLANSSSHLAIGVVRITTALTWNTGSKPRETAGDPLHAAAAGELPPHHRDPFDRMLVAQARVERLTLVSHDRRLEPYGGSIIWA